MDPKTGMPFLHEGPPPPFTKQRGGLDYFIRDILQTKNFGKICSVAQCEVPGLKPTACLSPADPAANWVRSWPRTGSLASPEGSVNEACLSPADPAANMPKYSSKTTGQNEQALWPLRKVSTTSE